MKGTAVSNGKSVATHGLSRDELLRAYRTMVLSRKLDDKEIQLKSQSLIFFQISGAGHEAIVTAAGFCPPRRIRLVLSALPRPRALPRARRDAARDAAERRRRQGRSELRRPADAVSLGTHGPEHRVPVEPDRHAVPAGGRLRRSRAGCTRRVTAIEDRHDRHHADEVTYLSLGDGTTSEGEFWEALNYACLRRAAGRHHRRGQRLRDLGARSKRRRPAATSRSWWRSFPGLLVQSIDGTDYLASYAAVQEAVAYARARKGPAFVHAKVTRPYSHSLSDDERLYKTPEERAAEAKRDPIARFADVPEVRGFRQRVRARVDRQGGRARGQRRRRTRARRPRSPVATPSSCSSTRPTSIPRRPTSRARPLPEGKPDTMVAAINRTLKDEMARNPRIVVFGEDVADCSREAALEMRARQGRRVQGDARPAARRSAATASSTRRSPKRASSAAASAWRRAASSRSSRSSSSTTSGRR